MYLLRILLLALTALGLQVPSGVALHWCRCESIERDSPAASSANEAVPRPSCCARSHTRAAASDDAATKSLKKSPRRCDDRCGRCLSVSAPDAASVKIVARAPWIDAALMPAIDLELATNARIPLCLDAVAAARAHEPPWARRNRQLLL